MISKPLPSIVPSIPSLWPAPSPRGYAFPASPTDRLDKFLRLLRFLECGMTHRFRVWGFLATGYWLLATVLNGSWVRRIIWLALHLTFYR